MKLSVICVGKIKEKFFTDACKEYLKRLSRFAKTEIVELNDEKIPDKPSPKQEEQIKSREGTAILSHIPQNSFVIALCIEGKQLSSEQLADIIADISMRHSHITFIIGGSLGLDETVKQKAQLRLSFSPMTFPHQLMRVVLLEQIYRAYKINANETYHK